MSNEPQDPLAQYGPTLAAMLLAIVLNLALAALVAGVLPLDYNGRALAFTGLLLYAVAGGVVLFIKVAASERGGLSAARVLRWALSMWLWPLLLR